MAGVFGPVCVCGGGGGEEEQGEYCQWNQERKWTGNESWLQIFPGTDRGDRLVMLV